MRRRRYATTLSCLSLSIVVVLGTAWASPSSPQDQPPAGGRAGKAEFSKLDPKQVMTLRGHKKDVWRVAFRPNSNEVATCGEDAQIIVWNLANGAEVGRDKINDHVVHGLDFVDGDLLAAVSLTPWGPGFCGILRILVLSTGESVDIESKSPRTFQCVASHPRRRLLAAGGADRALRVWDLNRSWTVPAPKNTVRREFFEYVPPSLPDEILAIAFHPQKPIVAAACKGGNVRIYEIQQDKIVPSSAKVDGHTSDVKSVKFRPGSEVLLTGGQDGTISYWNSTSGSRIRSIRTEAGPVNCLAFGPDGAMLASAHANKVVKLWDADAGKELRELRGHEAAVLGVDISADGRRLASCGKDFVAILWKLFPDVPVPPPSVKKRR